MLFHAMITVMNTFTRMMAAFTLSLSLLPGQAFCDVPKEDPFPYTPLEAAQEIRKQVQDAAQIEQMKEVLSAQQQALDALANDFSNSSSSRNAYSGDASSEGMPGFLSAPGSGTDAPSGSGSHMDFPSDSGSHTDLPSGSGYGTDTNAKSGHLPMTEAEGQLTEETITVRQLPEETETETEFHPLEMGAPLPDTGGELMEETETEAETESETDTESSENPEEETQGQDTGPGETEEGDTAPMPSRHGVFTVPDLSGLNEARVSLYDYRMLREIPLPRLPKDLHILFRQLKEQVASYDGTWSVYVQNLATGQILVINDISMRSASVMKLFIMGTVYEAFDRGDLPRNEDTVYLLRTMISNSSNESSNRLLTLLGEGDIASGIARVNEFIRLRGFSDGTVAYNGFEDPAASVNPDHPNIITARDTGLLLSRIYNRSFLSRKVCDEIEQMMLDQATRYKIPRGLPEGTSCGNKSGETDTIANDAAVVYGPTADYILVVLSNDWSNENTANEQIADISRTVYEFFEN